MYKFSLLFFVRALKMNKQWSTVGNVLNTTRYNQKSILIRSINFNKLVIRKKKSCVKAYEFIGSIVEREGSHQEASDNYFKAWTYCNKNQPSIGI